MMQRTRIYLVRHGQVEGHDEKRYNGQANVALTQLGQEQSDRVCDSLVDLPLDAVYSSDLDRSRHCAELIAATHNLIVNTYESLRELDIGDWEGRTWADLQATYPQAWQARLRDLVNFQVPGGESLQDAADRIRPTMQKIIESHPDGDVVLVAHGGANRVILLDAIGAPLEQAFSIEQDYGCLNIIDYFADGNSVVKLLNSTAHQADLSALASRDSADGLDESAVK
ncbi:MAG: alpha-ribazole phosphatase [Desulfuromonadales bacterium]|nr:alpha-ribazole phosphatase [Desulfuromonadales bacterium]